MDRVELYSRVGCHLCEDAHHVLINQQNKYPFALSVLDVDRDSDLRARFEDCVPVVVINGKVRFRGRVNPALLARILRNDAARGDQSSPGTS